MGAPKERNPAPTVDVIISVAGGIVLIKRKNPPHGWAIPGGFVEYGESVAAAARREAKEETSLEVELVELFHVYADPARDPRSHTISTVFLARAREGQTPRAADDAAELAIFTRERLPELAFDHAVILGDYFQYLDSGKRPPPDR
jgi:8-oxo-dGTP diphosphatase